MTSTPASQFSDINWLTDNAFTALKEISEACAVDDTKGRELLIRFLEHREKFRQYDPIINSLIHKSGLYPYIAETSSLNTSELLNYEFHGVEGIDGLILHAMQGRVYRALCDGANVILSAPTSFGKSLLIDAMIATDRYDSVVVIVPTIALIDETRRRLARRFRSEFKVITHPSQATGNRNIYVLTQERFVEFERDLDPQFFVVDEFYKLSPSRNDERTFVLNQAFYRLVKSGAQFFLIGPNIQDVNIDKSSIDFRYFQTDFSTVATEVVFSGGANPKKQALKICANTQEPTLIFCKSANSAYDLAKYLISGGVQYNSEKSKALSNWIKDNYHPEWQIADLLESGFAVHHGALPRSIAYHVLRLFNQQEIRFLLCTSTIIEGVNTSAKNIVIYDNKIATSKFDQFTFNNIKGRAGRMFKHFVGHVHVLREPPQPELPLVDIPSLSQPSETPESLLVHIEESDLSEESKRRLRYLHAQDTLSMDIIKANTGISPDNQIAAAEEIQQNARSMHQRLSWRRYPDRNQLQLCCNLIFKHLMGGSGVDGARSAKQMAFTINRARRLKRLDLLVKDVLLNDKNINDPSNAVESVLKVQRNLLEHHFPRYLTALDRIQKSVLKNAGLRPGDYLFFAKEVKHLFMPVSATLLEEYGLPFQLALRINKRVPLGDDVDEVLATLSTLDPSDVAEDELELEMLQDTIDNL